MDGLVRRPAGIADLMRYKNATLKFIGVTTIMIGMYVVYLGTKDEVIDADFRVV